MTSLLSGTSPKSFKDRELRGGTEVHPLERLSGMTKTSTSKRHVIFDCDGVLVDSEVIALEIESELLTQAGFPISTDEIADRFVGLSYTAMVKELESQFGRPLPADLVAQLDQRVDEALPDRLQPVAGIDAFLQRSRMPRCVASSSNLDRIHDSLAMTGLAGQFERSLVFSAQMVEHGKPAPDLFLLAAKTMGAEPSSCVVIEDSPHGVTAAVRAGMPVIGLVAGGHARPALADRLLAAGADSVARRAEDLDALL